jgi:cytochrome c
MAAPARTEATVVNERVPAAMPAPQGQLSEADALALAKKKNCFACHALDKKVVGPAWRVVAQKYRGDAGAQAVLEAKVRKGGKGNWGSIAMPPQPALSDEELSGLVQFVLQLQ